MTQRTSRTADSLLCLAVLAASLLGSAALVAGAVALKLAGLAP